MISRGDHVERPLLGMYESSPEAGRLHRTAPTSSKQLTAYCYSFNSGILIGVLSMRRTTRRVMMQMIHSK